MIGCDSCLLACVFLVVEFGFARGRLLILLILVFIGLLYVGLIALRSLIVFCWVCCDYGDGLCKWLRW